MCNLIIKKSRFVFLWSLFNFLSKCIDIIFRFLFSMNYVFFVCIGLQPSLQYISE